MKYFGAWSQKRKTNSHPHLRSLIGATGNLCVGCILFQGRKSKVRGSDRLLRSPVPPATTCLTGKITWYPGITVVLIWKDELALLTFQGWCEVLLFSKENLKLYPFLLLKKGPNNFPWWQTLESHDLMLLEDFKSYY